MNDAIKSDITTVLNKTQGLCWLSDDGKLVEKTSMNNVSVEELWDYLCKNHIKSSLWRFHRRTKRQIVIDTDTWVIILEFNMRGKFSGYMKITLDYNKIINFMKIGRQYKIIDMQMGDKQDYCKFSKLLEGCKEL